MTIDQDQLQRRIGALTTLQNISQELMIELDLERLLHKILDAAIDVLNATEGSLWIWVPSDELVVAVAADSRLVGLCMPADTGIAGWVFAHCEPLIVGDVSKDERFYQNVDEDSGFHTQSLIAVPLMTPTEKLGVVQVVNKKSGAQFDEQDLDVLGALAAQAAVMFVNARLYQEVEHEKNRIIALEDEMYKKLARDLHDGPAQTLAAMMMDIEFILKLYEREPARVPEELQLLRAAAAKTLDQVRTTMFELRPVILETQGLKPALEYYVDRRNTTEDMNIHLDVRGLEERLPPRLESLCFAIIHEAVGNVKKHAHAQNTWIVVERRERDLVVAIRDNGEGFDVSKTIETYDRRGSLGLLNIRERSELLEARYAIESAPGEGTLVYLIAPLMEEREPDDDRSLAKGDEAAGDTCDRRQKRKAGTGPLGLNGDGQRRHQSAGKRRKGTGPLSFLKRDARTKQEA